MWKAALVALTASGLAGQALAAGCEAEIAAMEQQFKLSSALPKAEAPAGSADTPATTESRGISPDDKLSQSGGVLAPPEGGRTAVIQPPPTGPGSTVTPPAVPPHTAEGRTPSDATELSAAKRTQVQTALNAAREAEGRGDEKACFERLGEARAAARPN
jgi:hypothetical protein